MEKIVLPRLFENMEEGTIGRWLVSEGEVISVGTPICELITEKTTLELPSEVAGTVRKLVAPEKAVVPPGFILALVGEPNEDLIDTATENTLLQSAPIQVPTPIAAPVETSMPSSSGRLRATPAARRAAKDLGIDLELVAQKFAGKVLSEDDVRRFAEEGS